MKKDTRRLPSRQKEDLHLFDEHPIRLEGFTLLAREVKVVGRPSIEHWLAALDFAIGGADASPFWIGALWNYAAARRDWQGKIEQALADLGRPLAHKTLLNLGYIDRSVVDTAKQIAPSVAHADLVAPLEAKDQIAWMEKAKTENMTVRELRLELRSAKRRLVVEGQAALEGQFRILYADPPWLYDDRQPSGSSSAAHYPGLTIEELCRLPIAAHSTPNSLLAMWVTAPLMLRNPGPREVGEAWGYTYKQQIVWDKVLPAGGNYTQGNHEVLTLWTRGSCVPDVQTDLPDSVQTFRKSNIHSAKPPEFRTLLEKHWTTGPYLELFGRARVEGWTVFGNDARLWAKEAIPA